MLDQTAFDHDLRTTAELAAGAGGWSLDIATGQQFCSPGLCHLLELNPEDVSTGVLAWQRVLAPADAEAANQLIEQSIRDRTAFMAAYQAMLPGPAQRWNVK